MDEKELTRDKKAVLCLQHIAKPKRTLERLTESEKGAIAAVWDEFSDGVKGMKPGFLQALGEVWEAHSTRWAEYLADNKATDSESEEAAVSDE